MKNKNAQKKCILNKIKMNSEIGVTMISLVVTVIILFIISSVSMNIGFETYNQTRVRSFVSKMKVIQSKVDMIAEQNDPTIYNNFKKLSDLETENLDEYQAFQKLFEDYDTNDSWDDNYYYFTPYDLESKLGLKDQELTVIINFEKRKVIAKKGVKKNGIEYHTQYELTGGDQLIK